MSDEGYGQPGDRVRSVDAGFAAHIVKPVVGERLHDLLDQLFAG